MKFDETTEQTPFSELMIAMRQEGDRFTIELPADWLQGRTAYGGLSAAICLEAILRSAPDLPPLRSAQFFFIGPATGQLQVSPKVLRRGKSAVHIGADLEGEAGLAVRASLCFGVGRSAAHIHSLPPMPQVSAPDNYPSYYTWPNRPSFMKHFDGRLVEGERLGCPGSPPNMGVWLRHHDKGDDSSLVRLLALADALPPAALILYKDVIPISTMMWSIDLLHPAPDTTTGWWYAKCEAQTSDQGYSIQDTTIWNSEGQPILVARQNVAIFG